MRSNFFLASILTGCAFFSSVQGSDTTVPSHDAEMDKTWGYHLVLDCRGCDIDVITSEERLAKFVKIVVNAIDMKSYGEPLLVHFAEHNPEAAGYSLLQFIETSSITGHFVDKNGDTYLDIFSCKKFDPEDAIRVVQEFLQPRCIKSQFLIRGA